MKTNIVNKTSMGSNKTKANYNATEKNKHCCQYHLLETGYKYFAIIAKYLCIVSDSTSYIYRLKEKI